MFKKGCREATARAAQSGVSDRLAVLHDLSTAEAVKEAQRVRDWSETRPEWGLSHTLPISSESRPLTQDFNLEGRTFLNSHDYRLDFTGAKLERIMNGPLAVGQWINGEHYFTATDPEVYGSGSKIYHNVVGRVAVMASPQSDLRTWPCLADSHAWR